MLGLSQSVWIVFVLYIMFGICSYCNIERWVYLEEGDNRVKVLLIFMKGHVLKGRASIRKSSIVSAKENSHSKRCVITDLCLVSWENPVQHLQRPPCVVATVPPQHHINLMSQTHLQNITITIIIIKNPTSEINQNYIARTITHSKDSVILQ